MTQKDKELLLKDLSARLPYNVKVKYAIPTLLVCIRNDRDGIKVITQGTYGEHIYNIEDIKPYLRPMSSMTEEEEIELRRISSQLTFNRRYNLLYVGRADDGGCNLSEMEKIIDYLLSHHLDFRGLIEKGLALEAPKDMYKINYL